MILQSDKSTKSNKSDTPSKTYYLVIDFEANCSGKNIKDHEIIEFPAVLVNAETNEIISEFRHFVKTHSGKKLSKFIKILTHITDENMFNGLNFSDCLIEFEKWCHENEISSESTTIVTVGDWDLGTMLPSQLKMTGLTLNEFLNNLFSSWTNVKEYFVAHAGGKAMGMAGMLAYFELELDGHHHSGIDDCRNTVKICKKLSELGFDMTIPTFYRNDPFWYYMSYA